MRTSFRSGWSLWSLGILVGAAAAGASTPGCTGKVSCASHEDCLDTEYCSPHNVCEPNPCVVAGPGFLRCDDEVLVTCDASLLPGRTDCGPLGCNPDAGWCNVCEPSTTPACDASDLVRCTDDGTWIVEETCPMGCDPGSPVEGTDATCVGCEPDTTSCVGEVLVACDGGGHVNEATPCDKGCNTDRLVCNDCEPSSATCEGGDLVACAASGEIGSRQVCDHGCGATPGTCNECAPGVTECAGDDLVSCSAAGRVASQQSCQYGCGATAGTCNECTPGVTECRGSDLVSCNASGRVASQQSCQYGCGATAGTCNECTPGVTECAGDDLVSCNAAGRVTSQQSCQYGCGATAGTCNECTPGVTECRGSDLVSCNASGRVASQQSCQYGCGATAGTCNECTPSTIACQDADLVTCDAAGRTSASQSCGILGCSDTPFGHCKTFTPTVCSFDHIANGTGTLSVTTADTLDVDTTAKTLRLNGTLVTGYTQHTYLQSSAPDIWAVHFDSVLVSGVVNVSGSRGLAITARTTMSFFGLIDASGHGVAPGPAGGAWGQSDPGEGGSIACAEFCGSGTGGGGHADVGGHGGASNAGTGAAGGSIIGDAGFSPLQGGGAGGQCTTNVRPGGGGGGILLLQALESIATGSSGGPFSLWGHADVSGGGGDPNTGGGAGGIVVMEAPQIVGTGLLQARGGGGGSSGSGEDGIDGGRGYDGTSGDGGSGGFALGREGFLRGGDGQFGSCNAGGGGGAAGRILVRVLDTQGVGSIQLTLVPDEVSGGAVLQTFTAQ